ncbi:hypothetical protein [Lacrimispora indolis]|uniref:hypothetical protein n=1 Tax=Lacrimispora indolis TaxID=69825 RepID=UPI00041F94E7|nr:hypothetical protein [[Clostridium] methoxybenzovorans]
MAYRTKVEVRTKGKVFPAGSILPDDISKSDLAFLKMKKFIDVVEGSGVQIDDEDEEDGFDEMDPGEYKTAEEVKKFRKKKDVYTYAASIGLDLGDDYGEKSLADLCDAVINFQEEAEAGADGAE